MKPHLKEIPEELVALFLGVDKHKDLALLLPLSQQLEQAHEPVIWLPDFHKLGDVLIDYTAASHLDLYWGFQG